MRIRYWGTGGVFAITGLIVAGADGCSSDTDAPLAEATDGGVVVTFVDGGSVVTSVDGGVVITYADGGVIYRDGGDPPSGPWDAGASRCAAGVTVTEPLGPDMWGCAGRVAFAGRDTLCATGSEPCSAIIWDKLRRAKPTHSYWLADNLSTTGSGANDCAATTLSTTTCIVKEQTPMRVCPLSVQSERGAIDAEGNHCTMTGCGYETTSENDYFGGCFGDRTAGTLCCPDGPGVGVATCSSQAVASEAFGTAVVGCAGSVTWAARNSLCGAGAHACSAGQWVAVRNGKVPMHVYWVDDDLGYEGSDNACAVHLEGGAPCTTTSRIPGHVCAGPTDPEQNRCILHGCGLETMQPSDFLGGCAPDASLDADAASLSPYVTAGTVCCPSRGRGPEKG